MNGYIAIAACGCTAGAIFEDPLDAESTEMLIGWLRDGCTVRALADGEGVYPYKCNKHFRLTLDQGVAEGR